MDIASIRSDIKNESAATEGIYIDLGDSFTALLGRQKASIDYIKAMFEKIKKENNDCAKREKSLFASFNDRYAKIFEALNLKIKDLQEANKQVSSMKVYSEEIELIAMNAMVISIKSGDKGRAFSSITESLQRLSTDMIGFSNKLIAQEDALMKNIQDVKETFDNMVYMHKALSQLGQANNTDVNNLVVKAEEPLEQIQKLSDNVYPHIQMAMEGLQLQDIVRQALDQVLLCLSEIVPLKDQGSNSDDYLDSICYNLKMSELVNDLLEDIGGNLEKSIDLFDTNWNGVTDTLNNVEAMKEHFLTQFLSESSDSKDNILHNLELLVAKFQEVMDIFIKYQATQKELVQLCQGITEKARIMYMAFESLKSVVSRLHHVRILQEIEVNKNEAIESVRDSVVDMDKLINNANDVLDGLHTIIESFMEDIEGILDRFSSAIAQDKEQMGSLRLVKNDFFNSLKSSRFTMDKIFKSFEVFPASFTDNCNNVKVNIRNLNAIIRFFKDVIRQFNEAQDRLEEQKVILLSQKGLNDWEIKDSKFREIVQKFTITSHKEVVGRLAGFDVEAGNSAGDVTFF